jgi:hypothetical protein
VLPWALLLLFCCWSYRGGHGGKESTIASNNQQSHMSNLVGLRKNLRKWKRAADKAKRALLCKLIEAKVVLTTDMSRVDPT